MGRSKVKKRSFLAANPLCYNCGVRPATTIDHVPSRECFHHRIGPEGFDFPACADCNAKLAQVEQAFALLVRLADFSADEVDQKQFEKLVRGVRNNNPNLLPRDFSSNREKRNLLKSIGYEFSPGEIVADVPIMKMDLGWRNALNAFSRKLLAALYYKEIGQPLSTDHLLRTEFVQYVDGKGQSLLKALVPMLPELRVGERRNTNIGEQFLYAYGTKPEDQMFVFLAQFAKAWFVLGVAARPQDLSDREGYIRHSESLAMTF